MHESIRILHRGSRNFTCICIIKSVLKKYWSTSLNKTHFHSDYLLIFGRKSQKSDLPWFGQDFGRNCQCAVSHNFVNDISVVLDLECIHENMTEEDLSNFFNITTFLALTGIDRIHLYKNTFLSVISIFI